MVPFIIVIICIQLTTAEHSGAYSSPQYAKKMYPKTYDSSVLLPKEKPAAYNEYNETNDTQYRSSFMDSAGSFLSSTGGQVMSSLAKDYLARSTGSSQVLSLNLTNLVILIVLKALVLAAGFFGAGAWKGGHHYGRSLDDNKNATYLSEDEIMLYLSYLIGHQTRDYGCLYRLSCQKPHQASVYAAGAELLLQGTKLFQGNSIDLQEYEDVSTGIRHAAALGEQHENCEKRFRCV
ncbi:uncharacterized protein LOC121735009 [Aricia agestis]|uniref:uncharacterized protein LOC121735009 n=1 Tax=Aricia agestis TaxID=91739 RepID=UPI001C2029DB|nr:uncharacterized protein LOC121735009 [Aricia agestis]